MTIETKFSVGDIAFFMEDNKVIESKIAEIRIEIDSNFYLHYHKILYRFKGNGSFVKEDKIFISKKDLIESL